MSSPAQMSLTIPIPSTCAGDSAGLPDRNNSQEIDALIFDAHLANFEEAHLFVPEPILDDMLQELLALEDGWEQESGFIFDNHLEDFEAQLEFGDSGTVPEKIAELLPVRAGSSVSGQLALVCTRPNAGGTQRTPASDIVPDLPDQIKKHVLPHKKATSRPPFSPAQLVVMAVTSRGGRATTQQIFDWIVTNFTFYRNVATKHMAFGRNGIPSTEWYRENEKSFDKFRQGVSDALTDFDTPLTNSSGTTWRGSASQARAFLALEGPGPCGRGSSKFLELPPEIRQRIYDFLLVFDASGIRYEKPWHHPRCRGEYPFGSLYVLERQDQRDFSFVGHMQRINTSSGYRIGETLVEHGYRVVPPRFSLLAILQVNKQIYQEALSTFMAKNIWYFPDVNALLTFLLALSATRKRFIEEIALVYRVSARSSGLESFKSTATMALDLVCSLPKLKKLHILVDEEDVLSGFKNVLSARSGFHAEKIPGFSYLKGKQGLDVEFSGDCARIRTGKEALLQSEPEITPEPEQASKTAGPAQQKNTASERYPRRSTKRVSYVEADEEEQSRPKRRRRG